MEAVVEPGNLRKALARVRRNKGAPGVDGLTFDELGEHLQDHRPEIRSRVLAGTYAPRPVRRVEIPIGVPTALDRFTQQAVLQGDRDEDFSHASYRFRSRRSAQQAVKCAQGYR